MLFIHLRLEILYLRWVVVCVVVEGGVWRPVHLLTVHHVAHSRLGSICPTWTTPREHY